MSDVICVTNRNLCREDFRKRIERIASAHPKAIIVREKDLPERNLILDEEIERQYIENYASLAKDVLAICNQYNTKCIFHNFVEVAKELNCRAIHLPFQRLQELSEEDSTYFTTIGVSCHSIEEAKVAEEMRCTYLIVGHIFETDCKKGLQGRGLEFLREVCESVTIPVYAIGGIDAHNISKVRKAGAAGACVMSGLMTCECPNRYLAQMEERT